MLELKSADVVYFTGTGGTGRIAGYFRNAFEKTGLEVITHELDVRTVQTRPAADLLVVVYPVHAFNAPLPVEEWLERLPIVDRKPAVVISVSGGGEAPPNTACRTGAIHRLGKKGYDVIYDKMLVMPSNWIVAVNMNIAVMLLRAAPVKVERIVKEIMEGKVSRTKPLLIDRFLSLIGRSEKIGARKFGSKVVVKDSCTGCGWCADACPRGNITMNGGRPVFGGNCVLCLRCIYGCPRKALEPGIMKFVVIKEGFDFARMEGMVQDTVITESVDDMAKGFMWSGVRKYLKENP